jgi:aryl-phospho-beta-D-glucosidase BglC (GH1 family)
LRGINISFHTNPNNGDFVKLASWGVNMVRLVIHADPAMPQYRNFLQKDMGRFNEDALLRLDKTIALAWKNGIQVIIDFHTAPGVKTGKLWQDYKYWDALESLWIQLATRYKSNPSVIGYDLLNEPNLVISNLSPAERRPLNSGKWSIPDNWRNTPRDYFGLMARVAKSINRIDDKKMVIVEGVGLWGNPVNFNWMEPIDACNVFYSFHMYIPHNFTDAGKNNNVKFIEYSGEKQYRTIVNSMKPVLEFAEKYHAQIFVGEFGLNYYNDGRGASQWLNDVLVFFEKNRWPWAYWTYSIPYRNPETTLVDGKEEIGADTERLKALKYFWSRNHQP